MKSVNVFIIYNSVPNEKRKVDKYSAIPQAISSVLERKEF